MENQYQRYIRKANEILKERGLCIWKEILDEEGKAEGRLERCNDECDGTDTNCEYYINNTRSIRR